MSEAVPWLEEGVKMTTWRGKLRLFLFLFIGALVVGPVLAGKEKPTVELAYYAIDNLMLLFAAVLVMAMQAGFATLEAGLTPVKNTVHILFKNFLDVCLGILTFYAVGYSIMYGPDASGAGLFGWSGLGITAVIDSAKVGPGVLHPQIAWLFQAAFAAAAATIVSGAVSGRMKIKAYFIYTVFICTFVYPISGFWKWGGGWLHQLKFYDFAGSVVVHSVGGFAALAAVIVIGPRIGRFNEDGSANHMEGHSLTLSALGVFILWAGWYGFNSGSQLAFAGSANVAATMLVAVNTTLAAAAGALAALFTDYILSRTRKLKLLMTLNGVLAGLVGITANCDSVTNNEAIIIGLIAGVLVVLGNLFLEKMKIDDSVGAWPVHGLCGVWGGLATGIFGGHPLGAQVIGCLAIPAWAFITMLIMFSVLKKMDILRVSAEEEKSGFDIAEHGEIEGA